MSTVLAIALAAAAPGVERPTDAFRAEHVEVKKHLDHIAGWVGNLPQQKPAEQKATMAKVVRFLREHLVPHAQWEDRVLYPLVDEKARTGPDNRFTAVMSFEHTVVVRWLEELERESSKPTPDAATFARRADNLLGLVLAHFESEEQVLLPILDKTMTKADFDKLIAKEKHH